MDRKSPKVTPGWLQPEKLVEFIDELREEYNYNIGVSQYIAAQELILALSAICCMKVAIEHPFRESDH